MFFYNFFLQKNGQSSTVSQFPFNNFTPDPHQAFIAPELGLIWQAPFPNLSLGPCSKL